MAAKGTSAQTNQGQAVVKKAQELSKELDRLIAKYGPTFPGLAAMLNGGRKLLFMPAPRRGLPVEKFKARRTLD